MVLGTIRLERYENSQRDGWLAVASIAVGAFVMVTTEFLPIGLLGRIAQDLHTTDGAAGLLLTAPGLTAAAAAPLATVWTGKVDRRAILLTLTGLIIVSNLAMAVAPSLAIALLARAVLGASVGGFWAFATAAARRLVSDAAGNRATTVILTGISLGTVLGVPVGALLGHAIGWRGVFLVAAGLALLVAVAQFKFLPDLPSSAAKSFRLLARLLDNRLAVAGLAASALLAGGHFAAYTYLEPYLRLGVGLSTTGISVVLACYGASGLAGTFLGERVASRHLRSGFAGVGLLLGGAVLAASLLSHWSIAAVIAVALWGGSFGALPVLVQIWTYQAAPEAFEEGSALTVTAFELALALGAAAGGRLFDHLGISATFYAAAAACALGAIVILNSKDPSRQTVTQAL